MPWILVVIVVLLGETDTMLGRERRVNARKMFKILQRMSKIHVGLYFCFCFGGLCTPIASSISCLTCLVVDI